MENFLSSHLFNLFSKAWCLIQRWYSCEKLNAHHSSGFQINKEHLYLTLVPLLQYLATCSLLTVTSSYEETSLSEGAEHLYTFQPSPSKYPCEMLHWPWCKLLQQLLANTLHKKISEKKVTKANRVMTLNLFIPRYMKILIIILVCAAQDCCQFFFP